MVKKYFTNESLSTFVSEIKGYADDAVSVAQSKADSAYDLAGVAINTVYVLPIEL